MLFKMRESLTERCGQQLGRAFRQVGVANPIIEPRLPTMQEKNMDDPLIRRSGHLLEAELGFELVGLDSHQGLCIGFNETAAWTWKLLKTHQGSGRQVGMMFVVRAILVSLTASGPARGIKPASVATRVSL